MSQRSWSHGTAVRSRGCPDAGSNGGKGHRRRGDSGYRDRRGSVYGRPRARSAAQLEGVEAELSAEGLQVDTLVRRGEPAAEIVAATIEHGGDLVAMATHGRIAMATHGRIAMAAHGRSSLARAILGSVAQRVLGISPVSVLLLRPGGHSMTRLDVVLLAVDGSPGGALAIAAAVPLARAANARVILLDVAVPFAVYLSMAGVGSKRRDVLLRPGLGR